MPDVLKIAGGGWCRFSRYELREAGGVPSPDKIKIGTTYHGAHFCIVRAPGAKLVYYDPWQAWEQAHPLSPSARKTPYQELLHLLRELRYEMRDGLGSFASGDTGLSPPLTETSVKLLLEWCSKWGLLGMLLHRARQATLAPHGQALAALVGVQLPVQYQYRRVNGGWERVKIISGSLKPEVLIADSPNRGYSSDLNLEPLSSTWSTFFPAVAAEDAETSAYPMPLSREFWRAYGEPVSEFVCGALALQQSLEAIAIEKPARGKSNRVMLQRGEYSLEALEQDISFCTTLKSPNGIATRLIGTTLLGSFTAMALRDLEGGGRIHKCLCGEVFVSSGQPNAEYCSSRCRWRFKKQRQRRSQKPEEV